MHIFEVNKHDSDLPLPLTSSTAITSLNVPVHTPENVKLTPGQRQPLQKHTAYTHLAEEEQLSSVAGNPFDQDPASNQGMYARGKSETSQELQPKPQALKPQPYQTNMETILVWNMEEKPSCLRSPEPALWPPTPSVIKQ